VCWLFLIVFVTGGAAVWAWRKREQGEMYEQLRKQAAKHQGRLKVGSLLYYPKMIMPYHETEFTVSAMLGGSSPSRMAESTYVTFVFGGELLSDVSFSVTRRTGSVQSYLDDRLTGCRIRTGNGAFDGRFLVKSGSAAVMPYLLSREIQQEMLEFSENVDIKFVQRRFVVSVEGVAKCESTFDRMLKIAIMFYGGLRTVGHEGIPR